MNNFSPAFYQAEIFLTAVILGIFVGTVIDFYRSLRNYYSPTIKTTFVLDVFLWCVLTAIIIAVIMFMLWGEVYFFTYLGLAAGYFLYLYTLSAYSLAFFYRLLNPLMKFCKRVINFIKKGWSFFQRVISRIFRFCRNQKNK